MDTLDPAPDATHGPCIVEHYTTQGLEQVTKHAKVKTSSWTNISSCFDLTNESEYASTSMNAPDEATLIRTREQQSPIITVADAHAPLYSSGASIGNKRKRNGEAARRYRKRQGDRITELEAELATERKELEGTRLLLAKARAEADLLRSLLNDK